ncbi:tRNA threonylcarbamoyladenosine dehydratase [Candidatus Thiothrix anitrata]|uniref:tRNA threonylcarbamoyladenosine dehydratase n=2 Tax=Candidatus Thiothrix anitrata TaxID=2823902 RepID=A0ABX7WYD3_9GAMM|nr:tRNA threonylcarbamoyladenosine dehydratase [Candidatus Thiothrix anitrata]
MIEEMDVNRRFGGIIRTYGEAAFNRFTATHICVIGVGGVGSWAVEALARSGIGTLTLVDLDNVTESNINRQLPALSSTIGRAKIEVLRERCFDINPACQLHLIEDFINKDNLAQLIKPEFDYVLDCIDNARTKAALIAYCRRNKTRLITVGGAGGQKDPTKIRLTDLSRTLQDPLLSKVRKELRQHYDFSSNPKRRFDIPAVWSEEAINLPKQTSEASACDLSCAGGIGSVMTVTASFALVTVSHVLGKLAIEPELIAKTCIQL